jgi:glycosyltransferase involved in cell wall biosynthesis
MFCIMEKILKVVEVMRFYIACLFRKRDKLLIHHGGGEFAIGGPAIKLWRMQQYFPDIPFGYNIVYSVSGSISENECQRAKQLGIPVVCHVNSVYHPLCGSDWQEKNKPFINIRNKLADFIVYGSNFAKEGADRYLGQIDKPYEIIYNALDTRFFRPLHSNINKNRFNVLVIGVHVNRTRIEPIIEAMPLIKHEFPQAKLIVAGRLCSGEGIWDCSRQIIEGICKKNDFQDIIFYGEYTQDEAPSIYSLGDIKVHLKCMDWTPNTVIESMACAVPVVYLGNGGIPELVGESGYSLGIPNDWESIHMSKIRDLAEAIIKLYFQRKEKGELARQLAVERFDIALWVKKHTEIFKRLLK